MANNVLPDPLNVNIASPDPVNTSIAEPVTTDQESQVKGVNTFVQDETTDLIDTHFKQTLNDTTVAVATTVNTNTIELAPGHGAVVGNEVAVIDLAEPLEFFIGKVIGVAVNVITIDSPVNKVYPVGALVRVSSAAMNVSGTPAAPVIFSLSPVPGLYGYINNITLNIEDNTAMDFTQFGGGSPLTNGCVVRVNHGNNTYTNLFNFKTNGDFILRAPMFTFQDKIGGGSFGFNGTVIFNGKANNGVPIFLDGDAGSSFEILVQDDLTGLQLFEILGKGRLAGV